MGAGHYSAEASVVENGKTVKGTLTVFADEYVFCGSRTGINWETAVCERGTVKVKALFRIVDKPCVVFRDDGISSKPFILDPAQLGELLDRIAAFAAAARAEREKQEEEQRLRLAEEQRLREEKRRRAEEAYRQKQKQAQREKEAQERQKRQEREEQARKVQEKQERLRREAAACKGRDDPPLSPSAQVQKAAACFLENPYRILGISCRASNSEANDALDKLKKLARLKALEAYKSPFDLAGLARPVRELSVAQNALALLKDKTHRFFWFAEPEPCAAWRSGRYRMELERDGEAYGTYDLFLANYLYALLCDSDFQTAETWKRILRFSCFLCGQQGGGLLRSRFSEAELRELKDDELQGDFRGVIFKPLLLLCERDDLDAVLRIHSYIKDCGSHLLDGVSKEVSGRLISWFTDKETDMFAYLKELESEKSSSGSKSAAIRSRGEAYCAVVEPMLEPVLKHFKGDAVRYEMIKESYRRTAYQLMYELNQCGDKSSAIAFANKCYAYCDADDKKRIKNTFGEVNIKSIDWNIPHTVWDIRGDEFYYGRGRAADPVQALHWYHKAADAGNMYSQNSIGICYRDGRGVPKDEVQAAAWFERAYKSGNPEGAYNLAECCFAGTGTERNVDRALKYWAEAARLGHPSAAQRRAEIFSQVQERRRKHRAGNHVCHDLGFQMTVGPNLVAEVTLSQAAYVYLVNAQGYQDYLNGSEFSYRGGYASELVYQIPIPSSNHWYVIVDNGDGPAAGIRSQVRVRNA